MSGFVKHVVNVRDLQACGAIFPVRVEDGDGNQIDKAICAVNIETGDVLYYPRNSEGLFSTQMVRDADNKTTIEVVKSRATYKTPIKFVGADGQDLTDKIAGFLRQICA